MRAAIGRGSDASQRFVESQHRIVRMELSRTN
jgi:hypothetical protein